MREKLVAETPLLSKFHCFAALSFLFAVHSPTIRSQTTEGSAKWKPSVASELLDLALEVTAREHERNGPRPTVGSRMLAIVVTCMHDAWAAYDPKASGSVLGDGLRRPERERVPEARRLAMASATHAALLFLFPEDRKFMDAKFKAMGFDPLNASLDPASPVLVGHLAAKAVLDMRRTDGANQLGDEVGSDGKPYSDWTFYQPVNPVDRIVDPDRWQPIPFDDGKGGKLIVPFLTPHWYRVKPFGIPRADYFRPGPPPKVGSERLRLEVDEVIRLNAALSPRDKALVEFMRDGPRSTGQSGHWLRFAQAVSARDKHDLDKDVLLFFAVGNTAFDAFVAAWDAKRMYDSSRPWTLVRHYRKGQQMESWAGPGKGTTLQPAEEWLPYSPSTFITPPFPGFVSGHSCVSAACARILELHTGSDRFGLVENRHAGELTEPGFKCEAMQVRLGRKAGLGDRACDVALGLETFSATARMAGYSRVLGGYHIQADNEAGLDLGRKVADCLWPKLLALRGESRGLGR